MPLINDLDDINQGWGWQMEVREEDLQERALQLGTLSRVYEQADRVLTGDPIVVNVAKEGPAPAWSDGATITFNASEILDMDLETLTQVNGLNYHELCHQLYTPRKGTEMVKYVIENQLMESMNILEDQRIETLFTARYPSVIPYLSATCARWLSSKDTDTSANYLAIRGRRYLPVEVREAYRDEFAFPELIPTIARIVDEYRLLVFPRDYERAKELIEQFNEYVLKPTGILDAIRQQVADYNYHPADSTGCTHGGPTGCGGRAPMAKGRPEPGKAQERDAQRAKGQGKAESDYTYRPKPKATSSSNGNKDRENNPGAGNSNQEESEVTNRTVDEALAIREETQYLDPGLGSGHTPSVGGIPEHIGDMLDDVIFDTLNNKDVITDIKAKQRIIVGGDGKYDDQSKRGKFDNTTVPHEAITNYRRFAKELQRLRDESEPGWLRETPSGKLNVKRAMAGCEPDVAFDRWDEGDDGCDIEAVICIDRSGSMSYRSNDTKASVACWTIKRALEHIGAPVTVYAFDDQNEVAYSRNEKADRLQYKFIYGDGGTNPYTALLEAEQLLMSSRKKNKMLFIITDGEFHSNPNDEVIERIAKRGILTSTILIMDEKTFDNHYGDKSIKDIAHKAEIFGRISHAGELLPFAKAVVTGAIRKRSRR